MESIRIRGLIVREMPIGDADKLIFILSADRGLLCVSCKGVRSIKSRRLSSTQLFCYGEFVLTERSGRFYLSESAVETAFFALNESLEKLCLGQYFCQVAATVGVENEDQSELLSLTLNCLFVLCERDVPPTDVKAIFETRLSVILGFCPDLSACEECGKPYDEPDTVWYFDVDGGSLICRDCLFDGQENVPTPSTYAGKPLVPLDPDLLKLLTYLTRAPSKKIFAYLPKNGSDMQKNFSEFAEKYLVYRLERSFETLTFYHTVVKH